MAYGNGSYNMAQVGPAPPTQAMPPKTSEIVNELDMQEKATDFLHEVVGQLEGRLAGVLGPEPPNGEGGARPMCATAIGQGIAANTDRVGSAVARLRVLLDRLAL